MRIGISTFQACLAEQRSRITLNSPGSSPILLLLFIDFGFGNPRANAVHNLLFGTRVRCQRDGICAKDVRKVCQCSEHRTRHSPFPFAELPVERTEKLQEVAQDFPTRN